VDVKTIQDLARAKLPLVAVCQRCGHRHLLFPLDLAERLGADFLIADLAPHLRCTGCQTRGWVAVHPSERD
jgi:hypothetical protein